ncbi:MAG TPA: hypothetical protein VKB39_10705 [Candidatus Baltobacteraceae bacterium]|nr:hypothetical protein [Candidatus Baltobacteraceae bacterium]
MTGRASIAIVAARLLVERRMILYACALSAVAGLARPHELAVTVFFCSALGVVAALLQTPGRYPDLDVCEQSAPLFGRQLARAKGFAPAVVAVLITLAYFAPQFAQPADGTAAAFVIAAAASIASTMVALCATLREGSARALYVALACATSVGAYLIAAFGTSIPGELAYCALVAFLALRQYGEALARFDPVPG